MTRGPYARRGHGRWAWLGLRRPVEVQDRGECSVISIVWRREDREQGTSRVPHVNYGDNGWRT
jgi:hypothetical protein